MISKNYLIFVSAILLSVLLIPLSVYSQIVRPTGTSSKASSQLIYVYDSFDEDNPDLENASAIQVTNTNDTEGVWIHVQVFRNFDPDVSFTADGGFVNGPEQPVICDERDFIDFLTPNDTHAYNIFDDPELLYKNEGESETQQGEQVNIDLLGTKGFIVITPIVSESDLTAISFQYLTGNFYIDDFIINSNAMGRDAVDFTTGETLPDGSPLDGETGGFVVLQPDEFLTDFSTTSDVETQTTTVQLVAIVFQDIYGPPGLLGYVVAPASTQWNSFIFDFKEDPTSCGIKTIECFDDFGLNQTFTQFNPLLGDDLLCGSTSTPPHPFTGGFGWVRIFVSGLDNFVNHLAFFGKPDDFIGGKWMFTK